MSSESAIPVVGTLPSGAASRISKGRTDGWSRIVVNHGTEPTARSSVVQPASPKAINAPAHRRTEARRMRAMACAGTPVRRCVVRRSDIADLLGAGGAHDLLRRTHLRRPAEHQDAELV